MLGALPEDLLVKLACHSRRLSLRKGDPVFLPGDAAALYVLIRGRVAILAQPTPEVEVELSVRRPYEVFGEGSLFAGTHVEQARALEPVQTLWIDAVSVRLAFETDLRAAPALGVLFARRLLAANERVAELGVRAMTERVLLLLTHLARDCHVSDSRGALITYRLTQDELARLVGASRVAVSHAMRRLREADRITIDGRRIIVRRTRNSVACPGNSAVCKHLY